MPVIVTKLRIVPLVCLILTAASAAARAQDSAGVRRICLAPPSVEGGAGSDAGIGAVQETFASYLSGPTLGIRPLKARLASQVREEAKQAGCAHLLLTTVKHEQKRGGGLLGRVAAGAAQQGAREAGVASSTAGRIAGNAAYDVAGAAASDYAANVHAKDELTLTYRLESPDGKVLAEGKDKRKAKADGEDLLTPMVQKASEAVAGAVLR
jgi:hypothetical protein